MCCTHSRATRLVRGGWRAAAGARQTHARGHVSGVPQPDSRTWRCFRTLSQPTHFVPQFDETGMATAVIDATADATAYAVIDATHATDATVTDAIASPVCNIRSMASHPPHCPRKARKYQSGTGVAVHDLATLTFEGRLALAADRPWRSHLVKRQRVTV